MKTFEVYKIAEDGRRTLVASLQADYYERGENGAAFYIRRFASPDREIAWVGEPAYASGIVVADTEFLISPPDPPSNPVLSGIGLTVDLPAAPTKRSRARKNDLLNLS